MRSVHLFFIFGIILAGCSSRQNKEVEVIEISHTVIDNEELLLGMPAWLIYANGRLFGVNFQAEVPFFYINPDNPDDYREFGSIGRGPDEFIYPRGLQDIGNNKIACYNSGTYDFAEFDVDDILNGKPLRKTNVITFEKSPYNILKTKYEQYFGIGPYEDCMVMLYDSKGKTVKQFFEFPYKDENEKRIKNRIRCMAYQGSLASNLDKTKFIFATNSADIIYFYEVSENGVELIEKHENSYADYVPEERGSAVSAAIKRTSNIWYTSVTATDRFVYILYSGQNIEENMMSFMESDEVHVYDWEGNLLRKLKLDVPCRNLCVSPDDKTMWLTSNLPHPVIVQFELPEIQSQ